MSSMSQYSFKCGMASCCSSTFYLGSFFTLLIFSLSYFGLPFFYVFLLIFPTTHFFIINSSFSTTIYSLYFSTHFFKVHSPETGSHASYMQLFISFLLLNILSQKCHQSSVISFSICFFKQIFQCVSHTRPFFHGGSGSYDF